VWWAKKAIFSFSFAPLEALGYVAFGLTLLSGATGAYQLVDSLRRPQLAHGVSSIIVAIAFFGSLNLLGIAVVGEYVIRAFDETKRRPRFIRRALWHRGTEVSDPAEMARVLRERTRAG